MSDEEELRRVAAANGQVPPEGLGEIIAEIDDFETSVFNMNDG